MAHLKKVFLSILVWTETCSEQFFGLIAKLLLGSDCFSFSLFSDLISCRLGTLDDVDDDDDDDEAVGLVAKVKQVQKAIR